MASNPYEIQQKKIKSRRKQQRPPRLRSQQVKNPQGPRWLRNNRDANSVYQRFFVPPPGFITFTTSRSEWTLYKAIWEVMSIPGDERQGPFTGYPGIFSYQFPVEGGRAARGGQVADFIIHGVGMDTGEVLVRLQTERYHQLTDYAKQAQDALLKSRLGRYGRVADIYEQDIMMDRSGQAACIAAKQAIFGGTASNPLKVGSARRIRL